MKTYVLTDSRKTGIAWLENNIRITPEERKRTQTEVNYKNGDTITVIQKYDQIAGRPITSNDKLIVADAVQDTVVNQILDLYHRAGRPIEVEQRGVVLTATDLKRRALMEQMEDLEREDRLRAYFKDLNLNGLQVTKTDVAVGNRSFTVTIQGKFV